MGGLERQRHIDKDRETATVSLRDNWAQAISHVIFHRSTVITGVVVEKHDDWRMLVVLTTWPRREELAARMDRHCRGLESAEIQDLRIAFNFNSGVIIHRLLTRNGLV